MGDRKGKGAMWIPMTEAIVAGDQDEAECICRQGCRQITDALRKILTAASEPKE